MNYLSAENISRNLGERWVFKGLFFGLQKGEKVALIGKNGTGKTTLMDTLAGATRQHGGQIFLAGKPLHTLASFQRAEAGIGWVPQERCIFKSLTVHENLTAVARAVRSDRGAHAAWTPERVYELFPRLAERKTNLGTQLSGGEQQMLALARALVLNPRLLLLDEPLEGLVPIIVQELLRAIARITREEGLSAIIVEQHPQAILAISHQAVVLDQGRVVHQGSAQTLASQPALLDQLLGVARA